MTQTEFKNLKSYLNSPDAEIVSLGEGLAWNSECINDLKVMFGREPITFWQFRRFYDFCDYLLDEYFPSNGECLSEDARNRLQTFLFTFIKRH